MRTSRLASIVAALPIGLLCTIAIADGPTLGYQLENLGFRGSYEIGNAARLPASILSIFALIAAFLWNRLEWRSTLASTFVVFWALTIANASLGKDLDGHFEVAYLWMTLPFVILYLLIFALIAGTVGTLIRCLTRLLGRPR
jgi:hypothetical protein